MWETKRHEEDMDTLSAKLRTLQNELSSLIHEKSIVETKLLELDQLVGQLLLVNESLVVRLSGKPIPKNLTAIKRKKNVLHNSQNYREIPLPRAAYTSTAIHEASTNPLSMKQAAEDAQNLHNIHRMYVDLARNITEKHDKHERSERYDRNERNERSRSSSRDKGSRMSERKKERDASSPHRVPFISSDYSGSGNNGNNGNSSNGHGRNGNNGSGHGSNVKYDMDESFNGNYSSSFIGGGNTPYAAGDMRSSLPANSPSQEGLQSVILSLEEEFLVLNDQYRSLLSSIKSQSPANEVQQEEELVNIIQRLHRKGEQLRNLKSPTK